MKGNVLAKCIPFKINYPPVFLAVTNEDLTDHDWVPCHRLTIAGILTFSLHRKLSN